MVGWRQTSARGVRMNLRSAKHAASLMNAFTDYLLPSAPDVGFKTAPLSASRDNIEEMCELGQRFISPMERCGGAFFHEAEVESSLMEDVEQTAAACKVQSWHLFSFYPWSLIMTDSGCQAGREEHAAAAARAAALDTREHTLEFKES